VLRFRPSIILAALALCAFALLTPGDARSGTETRIALVIGNANFGNDVGNLKNPVNDARLIADTFRKVGFSTTIATDLNRKQMQDAISDFGARLRAAGPDAVGVFYYAGQIGRAHV